MPYLSALEVCSWRDAIHIHIYFYLSLPCVYGTKRWQLWSWRNVSCNCVSVVYMVLRTWDGNCGAAETSVVIVWVWCIWCSEHETAIVELEKRQLLEKQQLEEMQLKEKFILQRQLLMTRQTKVSLLSATLSIVLCYARCTVNSVSIVLCRIHGAQ